MKRLYQDQNNNFSAAKFWFSVASGIILGKFALSGVEFAGITFGEYNPEGAAMLLSVFCLGHIGREHTKAQGARGDTNEASRRQADKL